MTSNSARYRSINANIHPFAQSIYLGCWLCVNSFYEAPQGCQFIVAANNLDVVSQKYVNQTTPVA